MGGYFINSTNTYSYYLRNTFNKVDYFIYFNNTYLLMLIDILKNVCTISCTLQIYNIINVINKL